MYAGRKPQKSSNSQNTDESLGKDEIGKVQFGRQASKASIPYGRERCAEGHTEDRVIGVVMDQGREAEQKPKHREG